MKFPLRILMRLILLLVGIFCYISADARVVRGVVRDSITNDVLEAVNVYFPKSNGGVLTNSKGEFTFHTLTAEDSIKVSCLGYEPKSEVVTDDKMIVLLVPVSMDLKEVVVNPGKYKYSKKNNPAVALMERVRKDGPSIDARRRDFFALDKHERIALGLGNYNFEAEGDKTKKRFGFLKEYVDTSAITGLPYLTLSVKDRLASDFYKSGGRHREVTKAKKSNGIDDSFEQENITALLYDIFREVDIYDNDIALMQQRFVSPLSRIGSNYYKYFITDTLTVDGERCIELSFAPHNPESMGFNGRMYIPAEDSLKYVRKIFMRVPSAVNLNYIKNLYILQDFAKDKEGFMHKASDIMGAEIQIIPGTKELYAERKTKYGRPRTADNSHWEQYFTTSPETIVLPEAENRDAEFWNYHGLTFSADTRRPPLLTRLRETPFFYWAEKILTILVSGYIKTGRESKFDIGPVNTLISGNSIEGLRLRVGGMTTANLSKYIFGRGYIAYGCKDRKIKYRAEADFSLNPKKYHSREFPVNLFRLCHEYEYDQIGQHYQFTNPDNVFLSLKRARSDKVTLRRLSSLTYMYENNYGFSLETCLRHERQMPTHWLPFITEGSGQSLNRFDVTSLLVKLRFAPGEKFYQSKSDRLPINMDAPIFQLTQEIGFKGLLGTSFTLNKTELSVKKRFWFSAFGFADVMLKGGMIWSKVYYPALMWANANLSYTIQPESFSLMSPMEFATDHYLTLDMTYWGNGILFNRLPLVKRAKLREVITFKTLSGGLNKRNNPAYNKTLLRFPTDAGVSMLSSTPYMELSAGIDNILTILRVDYVWRLTYRHTPHTDKSGVRVSLHFSF